MKCPFCSSENTRVIDIKWIDNETIEAVCTGEKTFIVRIKNGKIEKITQSNRDGAMRSALHADIPDGIVFPCHPGRQGAVRLVRTGRNGRILL